MTSHPTHFNKNVPIHTLLSHQLEGNPQNKLKFAGFPRKRGKEENRRLFPIDHLKMGMFVVVVVNNDWSLREILTLKEVLVGVLVQALRFLCK